MEKNIQLEVLGSRDRLSRAVLKAIDEAEGKAAYLTGGQALICLNYGGQLEISDAVKKMIEEGVAANEVTPELVGKFVYAPDVPACDLIVRTGSERA